MCSSKEPGDNPDWQWGDVQDDSSEGAPEEAKQTRRRVWRALVVVMCLAACLVAASLLLRRDPERHLAEARSLLDGLWLLESGNARAARAREAQAVLDRYLREGGKDLSGANLLLSASLVGQGRDQSPLGAAEFSELLAKARPPECLTEDLLIAASVFLTSGRLVDADRLITTALEREDNRKEVLRRAINTRFYVGRDEDVLAHCRELASLDPEDDYPLRVMGAVYENRVQWDQLIDVDRKLIGLAPPDVDKVRFRLMESLITTGRADEARELFERLRTDAPELLTDSPLTEAKLLHLEGKTERALAIVHLILAADPDDPAALLLAGRIQLAQSKLEEAISTLSRLTQIDPSDNEAHYLLGQAYARSGDSERASEHLKMHRRVLDLRVKLYELERRASRNPADVELRLTIAALYEELGWTEKVQFWRRAAESAKGMQQY